MGMTRLVDLSLNYFLAHQLARNVLGEQATTRDYKAYNLKRQNVVATRPIDVYVNGAFVDPAEYKVYPSDGKIVFNIQRDSMFVVTVDYYYPLVNVVDAYRGDFITPPIIAIDDSGDSEKGVELGTSSKSVKTEFRINVYAKTEGQRDDITDLIKAALDDAVPIWNFNNGFPVLGDGEKNSFFDVNDTLGFIYFDDPFVRRNPLQSSDPIELGRALITVYGEYLR